MNTELIPVTPKSCADNLTERIYMVTNILNYISNCPYLSSFNTNIDFLGKDKNSLSVSGRGDDKILKKYTDGDTLVARTYKMRLRLPFGIEKAKNYENSRLCENIKLWAEQNTKSGILPELSDDKIPVSLQIQFRMGDVSYFSDTAIYTADIILVFYKAK